MSARAVWLLLGLCGCSAAPPEPAPERELRAASAQGAEAFVRGDLRVGEAAFVRALELARLADDGHEVGNAAYNLAATRIEALGSDPTALLAEARAAFARAGETEAGFELALLEARARMVAGALDSAGETLTKVEAGGPAALRGRAALVRVELESLRGSGARAREALTEACAALGEPAGAPDSPEVLAALGHVLLLEGDATAAAAAFERAADRCRERGLPRGMARALDLAAQALARTGQQAAAADRWLRAAGAFSALRDDARAAAAAERAAAAAGGDAALVARAQELLRRCRG